MHINCIIVEDEPLAIEKIKYYIHTFPELKLAATFSNGMDALIYLKNTPVDLIFLDIHLGEMTGIQLLESAGIKSEVVITTAYNEFAVKGFDLNVTDYLMKPFTFERFFLAIEKVKQNLSKSLVNHDPKILFIKTEYRLEKVNISDIIYIEGMRDYRRVHTIDKRIMTLQTFREFERQIPSSIVSRIHKSYMVSIDKIDSIEKERVKIKELYFPISETYRKSFFELIKR